MSRLDHGLSSRRPSIGYYLALAAALVGLVCLVIAADGARRAAQGGDGLDALSGAGVPGIVVAWALAFYARLAFSDKLSAARQLLVHGSLRIVLAAELLGAAAVTWFVLTTPAAAGDLRGILAVGDLLQVGTAAWILHFYKE